MLLKTGMTMRNVIFTAAIGMLLIPIAVPAQASARLVVISALEGSASYSTSIVTTGDQAASARTGALQIQDGIYDGEGGAFVVLSQQGDTLVVKNRTSNVRFQRQPNGEFHYYTERSGATGVYRIIDPITIEWLVLKDEYSTPIRFTRRNGVGVQQAELLAGRFGALGSPAHQSPAYSLSGDVLSMATSHGVQTFRRGPDGAYRSELYDGVVRIVDRYTIDFLPGPNTGSPPVRISRLGDAEATAFADAQRAGDEAERAWNVEEARIRAEERRLDREEEMYAANNPPEVTTNNAGGILGAFASGFSEAVASNDAMEQSMRNAANEGLARGAAEYARRQNSTRSIPRSPQSSSTNTARSSAPSPAQVQSHGSSNAVALLMKGFRTPITRNAASNEMCFALVDLGPQTDDPDKAYSARRVAVENYRDEFFRRCSALGELGSGAGFNSLTFDEEAEANYARARSNRWMHEVQM